MDKAAPIPCVVTERLRLTAFEDTDAADLADILAVPEVTKNITANGSTPERCRNSAEQRIAWHNASWSDRGYGVWAVRSAEPIGSVFPGTLLGWCGFAAPDIGEDPEILYGLSPAVWGHGVATEAANAAITWLFNNTGQGGVSAVIFHRINAKSIAIVEKLGLRLRGTMPVTDFYSSESLARDVLDYELWRLAEGPTPDTETLLFEAPYRAGQLSTLGYGDRQEIELALITAAGNRTEFGGLDPNKLESRIRDAFQTGVNEPHLEWYHRKRPA